MYCHSCGQQIEDASRFCRHCGVQVPAALPPPGTGAGDQYQPPLQFAPPHPHAKSKIAAGILGIIFGHLGVHNFYLGFYGKAVTQLLLTILSCGFLLAVSWIWGMVEGIMILTGGIDCDADGIPLRE